MQDVKLTSGRAVLYEHFLAVVDFSTVYSVPASWHTCVHSLHDMPAPKRRGQQLEEALEAPEHLQAMAAMPIILESPTLGEPAVALELVPATQASDIFFRVAMVAPAKQKRAHAGTAELRASDLCIHVCTVTGAGDCRQVLSTSSSTSVFRAFSMPDIAGTSDLLADFKMWQCNHEANASNPEALHIAKPTPVFTPRDVDPSLLSRWELMDKLQEQGWQLTSAAAKASSPPLHTRVFQAVLREGPGSRELQGVLARACALDF